MHEVIGNTPMIEIIYKYKGIKKSIYAKLEFYNITGSIKDRMVSYILTKNKKNGNILPGQPLIEATSGNTGISLASFASSLNHPVYIFMPDFVSVERKKLLESYGAHITLVSKEEGGYDSCIQKADKLAKEIGGYRLDQFENIDNITAHYQGTGTEIVKQLKPIQGFVSGIGTGGTLMGVGLKIKETYPQASVGVVEPDTMTLLSDKPIKESHQIEGISDGFIPPIVDRSIIDKVYTIKDMDAIHMSQLFASSLGLGVGISSGANFLGSVLLEEEIGGNIVTIFPDDSKKYLSTSYSNPIHSKGLLSNEIELLEYKIV